MSVTTILVLFLSGIALITGVGGGECIELFPERPAQESTTTFNNVSLCPEMVKFDMKSATGNPIGYDIISVSPTKEPFSIDGQKLVCSPDLLTSQVYTFKVYAADGKYYCTLTFYIDVTLPASLELTLPKTPFSVAKDLFEKENAEARQEAIDFEFKVSDADANVELNPISPDTEVPFEAKLKTDTTDTYYLTLTKTLSTKSSPYSFTLKATKDGTETMENITVTLLERPVFLAPYDKEFTKTIDEKVKASQDILTLSATDADTDDSKLIYSVPNTVPPTNEPLFTVVGSTLKLVAGDVSDYFDIDAKGAGLNYTLTVRVSDGELNEETTVVISVADVNDIAPVFAADQNFNVGVLETVNGGVEVLKITATDGDFSAPNNEFTFSLSGEGNDHFAIDDTGSITVASPSKLDYSSKSSYNLTITVTDKGSNQQLSDSKTLTVTVETAPKFTTPTSTTTEETVKEDVGADVPIFTCTVTDEDNLDPTTLNYEVDSVEPSAGQTLFKMDGVTLKTGSAVTTSSFDLEAISGQPVLSYLVKIRVSDGKYSATAQITVRVSDVNDNAPKFESPITQTIDDTTGIDQEILTAIATDADVTSGFNTVSYSLAATDGSDDYTSFEIDGSSGKVKVTKELRKTSYNFTVIAKDVDNKEGNTIVTVTVRDNVDECLSSPCANSGSCIANINYFYCDCLEGWAGRTCNINIDDCDPNPCVNNGECTDGVASYTCNCSRGWTGTNCTQACTSNQYGRNCAETCQCNETRLAANTANQKCDITTGACKCNTHWSGDDCGTDVDECTQDSTLCTAQPNFVCANRVGTYECQCQQGYIITSAQACVAVTEDKSVTPNAGEAVVRAVLTQSFLNCDLTRQSVYDLRKQEIETAERSRIGSARDVKAFSLSCGSISYELAVIINDTDEARALLAYDLNEISNGKPLVLDNQSTVTTVLTVTGKSIPINSSVDVSVQICDIFTSYKPCGDASECKINGGTPYCKKKDTDNLDLILGLALGLSLGCIAIICIAFILCYWRKMSNAKDNKRSRTSRRYESTSRRNDMPPSYYSPTYDDLEPKVSRLPYAASIDYNFREPAPVWSRNSMAGSAPQQGDFTFYAPSSKYGVDNYKRSERF